MLAGTCLGIGWWMFMGYENLEGARDASEVRAAELRLAHPRSAVRGAVVVTAACVLVAALSTVVARGFLQDVHLAVVILGCFGLAQWVAVRRVERRRGARVYRRATAEGPEYVVCREALGR